MGLADAFLLMTGASYFAAALLPIQFEKNMDPRVQKVMYLLAGGLLVAVPHIDNELLKIATGFIYANLALLSYGGRQDWGSPTHNLFMTAWDLGVSVACFSQLGVAL